MAHESRVATGEVSGLACSRVSTVASTEPTNVMVMHVPFTNLSEWLPDRTSVARVSRMLILLSFLTKLKQNMPNVSRNMIRKCFWIQYSY